MNYGLNQQDIEKIRAVLEGYPEVKQAILYGSRAKGNYRLSSDVDISLVGEKLTLSDLLAIENRLDDLLLPYKIDLSIYRLIENPGLIAHIERVGTVFYEREGGLS